MSRRSSHNGTAPSKTLPPIVANPDLVRRIEEAVERVKKARPWDNVTRSSVLRELIAEGLAVWERDGHMPADDATAQNQDAQKVAVG